MAHNLSYDKNKGRHAFFTAVEKAWHNLGKVVNGKLTSSEAMKEALLDWTVEKEPVKFGFDNQIFDDRYVTVRQDTRKPLGIVGSIYEVVQNSDAFSFFDSIVGKDEAIFETAGALFDGQRIFITAKLPDFIQVTGDDDLIEKYLFLTTSHDGSGQIVAAFTPTRIVCNNTLNMAMKNMTRVIKIRHTRNAQERLIEAHKVMGMSNKFATEMAEVYKQMSKKKIVEKDLIDLVVVAVRSKEFLNTWHKDPASVATRTKNVVDEILEYNKSNPTQHMKGVEGTVYGALNAVTGYWQNVRTYSSADLKMVSQMEGTAYASGQRAFDYALELMK